jgi:hypothetical protein
MKKLLVLVLLVSFIGCISNVKETKVVKEEKVVETTGEGNWEFHILKDITIKKGDFKDEDIEKITHRGWWDIHIMMDGGIILQVDLKVNSWTECKDEADCRALAEIFKQYVCSNGDCFQMQRCVIIK